VTSVLTLLMLLGAAGAAFFLVRGIQGKAALRSMTNLEVLRAERDAATARENRMPARQRANEMLRRNGYDGDLFPVVAAMGFLYLFAIVLLRVIGLAYPYGAFVALPAAVGIAGSVVAVAARRRRRKFNQQLVELLDLLASQVASGHGAHKALTIVVPTMQEPLRAEMSGVLEDYRATKDLVGALTLLAEKYPSRAMAMFVSALEIDRAEGQAIGPALKQAADLLKRDFALAAEANAEISQTRGEFFGVIGILGLIAGKMIFGSGSQAGHAYTSGVGLIVLVVGFANVLFGIWRFLRLLNSARGDT